MNKVFKVFIDTSAFKALVDSADEFYIKALTVWQKLAYSKKTLVTSNYVLDESFTLIRVKCGLESATAFKNMVKKSKQLKIERVKIVDENKAWQWFAKDWSRLSFTDCVSFAQMKKLGIKQVFSFDKHFSRAGFELVN